MSSSDVMLSCESVSVEQKQTSIKDMAPCDEKEVANNKTEVGEVVEEEDQQAPSAAATVKRELQYVYDNEILLELRSAPASLLKPDFLQDEYFNKGGRWDPEMWCKSNSSRSASPAVDGKNIVIDGKKVELMDDSIKLAPHGRSFKQGCHVQQQNEEKVNLPNPPRSTYEKKNRLTGRAANLRRTMENEYREHESNFYDRRNERFPKERGFFNRATNDGADKEITRKERMYNNNRERRDSNRSKHDKENTHWKRHHDDHDALPEWMTDGPTSQLDTMEFTGFQEIEEEKKAFSRKKKKVRISPDVFTQKAKVNEEKPKAKTPPPPPKVERKEGGKQSGDKVVSDQSSKPDKNFDLNEFFNEVDYYPPRLFHEDITYGDGVKSRFTQYFQNQMNKGSNRSSPNVSRKENAGIIPNEIITGSKEQGLAGSSPYFAPIQPAPALVAAAASAHAIQTSNILSIIQKQKEHGNESSSKVDVHDEIKEKKQEVRGRLTVADVEEKNRIENLVDAAFDSQSVNAFSMFVKTMKDAGQLPEKPSPIVTGLPEHLLPKPPNRSSPVFQKLKQSLNRSPSPQEYFKAVSTIASIVVENPTIEKEIVTTAPIQNAPLPTLPHNLFTNANDSSFLVDSTFQSQASITYENATPNLSQVHDKSSALNNSTLDGDQKPIPKGFLPTSVIKKMHEEKHETPSNANHDGSILQIDNVDLEESYIEKATKVALPTSLGSSLEELPKDFEKLHMTPERATGYMSQEHLLSFHSAPVTPRQNALRNSNANIQKSVSAPGTPEHSFHNNPPPIQRLSNNSSDLLLRGSAFTSPNPKETSSLSSLPTHPNKMKNSVGVIGSGKRISDSDSKSLNDPFLAHNVSDSQLLPGSSMVRSGNSSHGNVLKHLSSTPMPNSQPSQQQQLLHAQRMAQIQQAQLLQQQKLQQIAQEANQRLMQQQQQEKITSTLNSVGVKPLLPDPDSKKSPTNLPMQNQMNNFTSRGEQMQPRYQHQQRQQIQAFQQQQQQKIQQQQQLPRPQVNNFRGNRPFPAPQVSQQPRNMPPLPLPMQQAAANFHALNNLNRPQGLPNFAAQALVQQQLLNQAARARFLAQAQLLQQQPQVMQAAIMAQAALARGQAHALMMNQMGLRSPVPSALSNNKSIPTPMLPNHGSSSQKLLNGQIPAQKTLNPEAMGLRPSENNVLKKWFNEDVLNQLPQKAVTELPPTGQIFSVEDLEKQM